MCVSTVDALGHPHARFVDLKEVRSDGFVFCTSLSSPKAQQIDASLWVSLTFWWDHVGRQVRVLGTAARISETDADAYFLARPADAQLASWAFEQSQPIVAGGPSATERLAAARQRMAHNGGRRPPNWGGYVVAPRTVEFLTFSEDRVHHRVVFTRNGDTWLRQELQP